MIKELDVVGELTPSYKETSATRCEIGMNVTSIDDEAFSNCSGLISVTIPNSVTHMRGLTFYKCTSLTSVTMSNQMDAIGDMSFYNCTSLTTIEIPNTVIVISSYAFKKCTNLSSVTYNGVTYTSKSALETALRSNGVRLYEEPFELTALSA